LLLGRRRPVLTLNALEDAGRYIQKLPKAEQQLEEWQTAVEVLILAAESNGGPTMMARIGVMRALNRNVERVFTSRKEHHWGRRKTAFKGCLFVRKTELALHTLNNGHYRLVSLLPIGSSELYAFEGPICIEM
jgi:hypothetical protein